MKRMKPTTGDSRNNEKNSSPWWMSTAAKGSGLTAGILSMLLGIWTLFSFSLRCVFAGGLLITEGFVMTLIEAPCFCMCIDFAYYPSNYAESKPNWMRATLYLVFAVLPFTLCPGLSTFLSSGSILLTCALYLMQSLGKKASRDEMMANASISEAPKAVLVENEQIPGKSNVPDVISFSPKDSQILNY